MLIDPSPFADNLQLNPYGAPTESLRSQRKARCKINSVLERQPLSGHSAPVPRSPRQEAAGHRGKNTNCWERQTAAGATVEKGRCRVERRLFDVSDEGTPVRFALGRHQHRVASQVSDKFQLGSSARFPRPLAGLARPALELFAPKQPALCIFHV